MDVRSHSPAASARADERRAVIDIGSNSVRLVVYDGPRRAPFAICNEKALCGLGRDLAPGGRLDAQAVEDALATLGRFRRLLDDHGALEITAVATAAVREAADGADFVARANALGFDIQVIDGVREAELAALGVISYEPGARGIVGDMGGGSLELVQVSDGAVGEKASLPIGPLRFLPGVGGDPKKAKPEIEAALDQVDWLGDQPAETLYTVGGAWRAIARLHMRLRLHPLLVLHHYELSARAAIDVCDFVARQSRQSLSEIPGIPRRRIETLPFAATALAAVVRRSGARRVLVSAGGVREGLLYDQLAEEERAADPLLVGADYLAARLAPTSRMGPAVARTLAPLFAGEDAADPDSAQRVCAAACLLVDIGAYFHPDMRGRHAFDTALRAPFYGVSHAERAGIALALLARHEGRSAADIEDSAVGLLDADARARAVRLGLALRFVTSFAPKTPDLLDDCAVRLADDAVVFRAPAARRALYQELAVKRHDSLAASFDKVARTEFF